MGVGTVIDIPKGFAQEWLRWHDAQKSDREINFRTAQIFWTKWAALAATGAVLVAAVGRLFTLFRTPH